MIDICFVHFRTLNLEHLDAAWYSLSKQDFSGVRNVFFLDNNTEYSPDSILSVLYRYPLPCPLWLNFHKHGLSDRTQSWSVNTVCKAALSPWVFFTRTDYILAFDCLSKLWERAEGLTAQGLRCFLSGWCWQMAYDREARNIDAQVDIEQYNWRELGMEALLRHPYAFRFHETDQDAGVWLTKKENLARAGWMNEGMVSWGFQQSTFQRALRNQAAVHCEAIQDYLFAHQHHYAERDFGKASQEYLNHGGGR
jgi:hypothetical protein